MALARAANARYCQMPATQAARRASADRRKLTPKQAGMPDRCSVPTTAHVLCIDLTLLTGRIGFRASEALHTRQVAAMNKAVVVECGNSGLIL